MAQEQIDILSSAIVELKDARPFALCIALETQGSSPRAAGTWMGVKADGSCVGTIGGGAIEALSIREAQAALSTKASRITHHTMGGEDSDTGMICGGGISLAILYLNSDDISTLAFLHTIFCERRPGWLLVYNLDSVPQLKAFPGDKLPPNYDPIAKCILGSSFWSREKQVFLQKLDGEGISYVFGAGHVGQALALELSHAGFDVVVFDNRPTLARPERFPFARKVILGNYACISDYLDIKSSDLAVIATASHRSDTAVVLQVMSKKLSYVGCLGSKQKTEYIRHQLKTAGFKDSEISRLHMPVGISIGAETPAEIAVSVAAEMIAFRRRPPE